MLDINKKLDAPAWEEEMRIYEGAVERFGRYAQVVVAIEEMSELIKALTKWMRNLEQGGDFNDEILDAISEERADVSIMLSQLDVIFGDNTEMEIVKLLRLKKLLQGSPYEK